jgi:peptide chain release factor subunit 1
MTFDDKINNLLKFKSDKYPITSLYLKLGPNERENVRFKIALKNLIKEQREKLNERNFSSHALKSIESDMKKITDYFDNPDVLTGFRGIALFSSTREGVWEVFKLPFVYRNRLVVDSSPLMRQLVTINDEFGDIVVVCIDRKKARLFRISFSGAEEIIDYFYPGATRNTKFQAQEGKFKQRVSLLGGGGQVAQGFGEYGFQRMIENEMHQHFKHVSDSVFEYYKQNKFDWLIIGGIEQVVADFSNHLHTYLKEKCLGTLAIEINLVKPDDLVEKALDLLEFTERRNKKKLIKEFEQRLVSGYAVNGIAATLKALAMGQVRILIVAEGFFHSGFVCPESRILVLEKSDDLCPEGKKPIPVVDIVDEMMEEALRQGAEVEVILDEGAKKEIYGIGAILRFKL